MRDPNLVLRAERAATALEQAWFDWRVRHGLGNAPMPPVSSYVGYSMEEPWGQPRVVFGVAAEEAERLAALLEGHDCNGHTDLGRTQERWWQAAEATAPAMPEIREAPADVAESPPLLPLPVQSQTRQLGPAAAAVSVAAKYAAAQIAAASKQPNPDEREGDEDELSAERPMLPTVPRQPGAVDGRIDHRGQRAHDIVALRPEPAPAEARSEPGDQPDDPEMAESPDRDANSPAEPSRRSPAKSVKARLQPVSKLNRNRRPVANGTEPGGWGPADDAQQAARDTAI